MPINRESIRQQIAHLIGDDPTQATFRDLAVTVRRDEAFSRRQMVMAGVQPMADFDVWITADDVAGQGDPQCGEVLTMDGAAYEIRGVSPGPARAFWRLSVARILS